MRLGTRLSLIDGAELDDVTELPAGVQLVQFRQRLTDDRFRHLARLLDGRPEVGLRAYLGSDIADLEFLRLFAGLRSFQVDSIWDGLTSIDGLRHASATLESLAIGRTKRPLSLAVLGQLDGLRTLAIEGQHRDLAVLAGLHTVETLTLRSITLADLGLLMGLDRLRSLALKLGGTNDLAPLPRVGRLEELELWHVRGLADVTPVGSATSLKRLFLQAQPQVRALPDLSQMTELSDVTLHTMKGITDLSPLASAPALAKLSLIAMPHLSPESLRALVGHPTLRRGSWNIGSMRKTYQAHDILPVAPEPFGYSDWQAGVPYRTIVKDWLAAVQVGTREVDGRMVLNPDRASTGRSTPEDS